MVQNIGEDKYKDISIYDYTNIPANVRGMFGYRTGGASSGTSRSLLYKNVMCKALELNADKVCDRTLVTEFVNLTTKGGRIDHANGKHDDQVISLLLACYLIFYGRNLDRYNINSANVLSMVTTDGVKIAPDTRQSQMWIKKRISELESYLSSPSLPLALAQSYKRELNELIPLYKEKLNVAAPLAVSQVNYQEKQINNTGNSLNRLKAFTARFLRS